jgi:hypothetical protein
LVVIAAAVGAVAWRRLHPVSPGQGPEQPFAPPEASPADLPPGLDEPPTGPPVDMQDNWPFRP